MVAGGTKMKRPRVFEVLRYVFVWGLFWGVMGITGSVLAALTKVLLSFFLTGSPAEFSVGNPFDVTLALAFTCGVAYIVLSEEDS